MPVRMLLVLLVSMISVGCGMLPPSQSAGGGGGIARVDDDPDDDPHDFGTPGDPEGYSHSKVAAVHCSCLTDRSEQNLALALAALTGKPLARAAIADRTHITCMNAAGLIATGRDPASFTPPLVAGPPGEQRPHVKDLIGRAKGPVAVALGEDGRVTVTEAKPRLPPRLGGAGFEVLAASLSDSLQAATLAQQACSAMSIQRATALVMMTRHVANNHGLSDLPIYAARERARMKRVVAASKRADSVAAAATALTAAFRDSVQARSAEALLATMRAIESSLPLESIPATEAELEALMAMAEGHADVLDEGYERFVREHYGARSRAAGPMQPRMSESEASDAASVAGAFVGLFQGDIGAIVQGASVLFPEDSPIRHGMAATAAIMRGDAAAAMRSAIALAPEDSQLHDALAELSSGLETAQAVSGRGKKKS